MANAPNLARKDLSHVNLAMANLAGADLHAAILREATLKETNLTGADLTDADLTHANLAAACLRDATVAHANLQDADLRDADLEGANLRGAHMAGAKLRDADRVIAEQGGAEFAEGGAEAGRSNREPSAPRGGANPRLRRLDGDRSARRGRRAPRASRRGLAELRLRRGQPRCRRRLLGAGRGVCRYPGHGAHPERDARRGRASWLDRAAPHRPGGTPVSGLRATGA